MHRRLLGCSALAAFAAGLWAIPTTIAAAYPVVVHAPRVRAKPPSSSSTSFGWASSNWSGYALASSQPGTYTAISGSWVVPKVAPSKKPTYSAAWVGIDGFNNSDLIQTGTEQDFVNGSAQYYAWWEVLPAPETVITTTSNGAPFKVQPGDRMTASLQENSNGTWTITLSDTTQQESYSTTVNYSGPLTSAEWILEAPTVGGRIATLANYGQTVFDPGTVNGGSPNLAPADGGVMVQNGRQVSTPSVPDSDADGFAVQYGSTVPQPPTS
ncbi:MAG: hypothetical protein K6U87_15055 [Firmicutes bacterium]|nr:hypothetical protein [Bacillota bacterium]